MEHNDDQSSTDVLSTLSRLHREGSLSDDEFFRLKRKISEGRETSPVLSADAAKTVNNGSSTLGFIIVALIGLIVLDHIKGSILPDELYCVVGAGTSIIEPGRTEANAWSANNGCSASRPECATSWVHRPPTQRCVHGTLWNAIYSKIENH